MAIYVDSAVYCPPSDNQLFELLWIKCKVDSIDFYLGGLYHPPKPIYQVNDFVQFVESSVDSINNLSQNCTVTIAGDVNQLSDNCFTDLGLLLSVHFPTHRGHCLDKIFVSPSIYDNLKAIKSSIKTEHSATVARSDDVTIVDHNKTRRTCTFRQSTPALNAAFLSRVQTFNWDNVVETFDIHQATDAFYTSVNVLLNSFYPNKTVTITSRDPPYITPVIKRMMREKNFHIPRRRVEQANALALRIGSEIIAFNSGRLKAETKSVGTRDMWSAVRDITANDAAQHSAV